MSKKKVLIVGAGAVGSVYGYYLYKQCDVTFLVKPYHLANLKNGFDLHFFNKDKHAKNLTHYTDFELLTTDELNTDRQWDYILLAVPSSALGDLPIDKMNTQNTTVVLLSPGQQDTETLVSLGIPDQQIVAGMIMMISYQGFLGNDDYQQAEDEPLRISYYLPPMSKLPFSSNNEQRVQALVDLFNQCELKARVSKSVFHEIIHSNILLMCIVLAMEKEGWTFEGLRNNQKTLAVMIEHIQKFFLAVEKEHKITVPFFTKLLKPWMFKTATFIAPQVIPIDVEKHLSFHYTKVGKQTRQHLAECVELCEKHKIAINLDRFVLQK